MKIANLNDLLIEELKDIYSAEKQITKALPKMAKAAHSPALKDAFSSHLAETQVQIERLDKAFELLEAKPGRKKCKAMEGLLEEGADVISEDAEPSVHDAALIAAAQRVEHYEIAAYGSARTFAKLLGLKEVAQLLDETLQEEGAADKKLTKVAMSGLNQKAAELAEAE